VQGGPLPSTHADFRELAKLLRADMVVDVVAREAGTGASGRAIAHYPSRAPADTLALVEGATAAAVADTLARAIIARMRAVPRTMELSPPTPRTSGQSPPSGSPGSATTAGPRVPDAEIVRDLQQHMARLAADSAFSGAVLLAKNGKVLFQGAAGLADRASHTPNRVETRFNIGSMNKMFTAVAVLQLTQAGRLSLDDTLRTLLPDYPTADVAGSVTVRQLLTHTAGLGDVFDSTYLSSPARYRSLADYLPLFVDRPLLFAPGTKWSYSNAGYVVLGLLVERVSGQPFDDYVRDHVFRPAGMTSTGNYDVADGTSDLAIGYTTRRGLGPPVPGTPPSANSAMLPRRGSSTGGGYSTVEDLFRFGEALRGHRLLDSTHTAALMTGAVVEDAAAPEMKYALGMEELTLNGVRVVGHGGSFPGVSSIFDIYPAQGYTLVVLSNVDNGIQPVGFRLRWVLRGQVEHLPRFVRLAPEVLRAFAGRYRSRSREDPAPSTGIAITADSLGLLLDMGGRAKRRFVPLGAMEFGDRDLLNLRLNFATNAAGVVTSLTLAGGGPPIEATRVP
jgi:CubicO group peptidase (beta-lactamase class C family)